MLTQLLHRVAWSTQHAVLSTQHALINCKRLDRSALF